MAGFGYRADPQICRNMLFNKFDCRCGCKTKPVLSRNFLLQRQFVQHYIQQRPGYGDLLGVAVLGDRNKGVKQIFHIPPHVINAKSVKQGRVGGSIGLAQKFVSAVK